MKILAGICFLIMVFASPLQAAWYDQLPEKYNSFDGVGIVEVEFHGHGSDCTATFYMKDGSCTQFEVENDQIVQTRTCSEECRLRLEREYEKSITQEKEI